MRRIAVKKLSKIFLTGLVAILPILATMSILSWLAITAETFLGKGIRIILSDQFYRPGMGVVAGVIVVFLIGLLLQAWVVRKLFDWAENLVYRIPFVKSVYGSLRDFIGFVSGREKQAGSGKQVVMVKLGDTQMEIMGFVTRRDFSSLPAGVGEPMPMWPYISP